MHIGTFFRVNVIGLPPAPRSPPKRTPCLPSPPSEQRLPVACLLLPSALAQPRDLGINKAQWSAMRCAAWRGAMARGRRHSVTPRGEGAHTHPHRSATIRHGNNTLSLFIIFPRGPTSSLFPRFRFYFFFSFVSLLSVALSPQAARFDRDACPFPRYRAPPLGGCSFPPSEVPIVWLPQLQPLRFRFLCCHPPPPP